MRRFLFLFLMMLCSRYLIAQNKKEETALLQTYSKQSGAPEEDTSVWLVHVGFDNVIVFQTAFKNSIQRRISNEWFIVKRNAAVDNNKVIEKKYAANFNWKASPSVLRLRAQLPLKNRISFIIQATSDSLLRSAASRGDITIVARDRTTHVYQVLAFPQFILLNFLFNSGITFIDAKTSFPKEETVINDYDNSVNGANLFESEYPAIRGDGLTVSVKENLFDTTDIDFKGRYQPTNNASHVITSHATTMATLIGGGGNSFHTGKGIAPGSLLSSSDFANLLPDGDSTYTQFKISVQNHSYGTDVENFYGADAAAFDESAINNPALLFVFSAGNSGTLTDSLGRYKTAAQFANLTGSFKQAKNIITVGSVDSFYLVPAASSKGPAYDGRIKPELVAYGNDGSSGAAAITSGTALAVQAAYAASHHDSLPPNTLVKAILLNSADDVLQPGPDFYSGYGNVNVYQAVRDVQSNQFFKGEAKPNSIDSFFITIPPNTQTLKAMLVWNDAPAAANAFTALVNDLDLEIKNRISGTAWLPWVLNAAPDSAALLSPPVRRRDSLNVVEQITLSQPAQGEYVIYVKGYHLTTASQPYHVVYEIDAANRFQFISPSAADHFIAGKNGIVRWKDTYNNEATGKLEYSVDAGPWQLIDGAVPLLKNYFNWQAPDIVTTAQMRMTIGNDVYLSHTFDVSEQPLPRVVLNCSDSAVITWQGSTGIHRYQIFQLGNRYLQPYATVSDTGIVIKHPASPYFAVAPLFDDGREGARSYTFNYASQGAGCYINNFLADLTSDNKARLSLTLGTTLGVDSVQFQQFIRNRWQTLSAAHDAHEANLIYLQPSLLSGINAFRAVVWVGGKEIISGEADILYFPSGDFIAKPNPLPQGQNLTLFSSTLVNGTLVIYDVWGRNLWQQSLTNTVNVIPTNSLQKGVYFLVVYDGKQKVFRNKLAVE